MSNPFVNTAFNDDWSYSDVALKLAQTGHLHYNGWGSPTILFQSFWAAFFIRLFGFSFNLLRFVSLPFSVGFVCLTYLLGRRLGLRRQFAGFAALTVAVSPLFIPVAASFMTEPYACFFTLLCIYSAVQCAEHNAGFRSVMWLWALATGGILGGSDRQTLWLLPLLLLPYLAWLKRWNSRFLFQFAIAYSLCVVSATFVLIHFHTSYAVAEITTKQWLTITYSNFTEASHYILSILLVTALMCLPSLLCVAPLFRLLPWRSFAAIGALCLLAFDYLRSGLGGLLGVAPFLGNILTIQGIIGAGAGLGPVPKILHIYERYPLTAVVVLALATWVFLLQRRIIRLQLPRVIATMLLLFAIPYLCLLIPGALLRLSYDRYALVLLPVATLCVLLSVQNSLKRIPTVSWAVAIAFAVYGTATTHDYARYAQARATAVELAQKKGIPRLQVGAGLESDGWTQVQTQNRIAHAGYNQDTRGSYNILWFSQFTPAINPEYVTFRSPHTQVPLSAIAVVPFTVWLPFSHEAVSVLSRLDVPQPRE